MTITTLKFSEFVNGGNLANSNITVGLNPGGDNAYFNNPWTFLASGTTGDRPAVAASMYYRLRFNTDLSAYEYYNPLLSAWVFLSTSSLFAWNDITGTSATMMGSNGYLANNPALVTLTLPSTSGVGDQIAIQGVGAGGWRVAQNAGQKIIVGAAETTVGVTGLIESTNKNDSIILLCITANTTWAALGAPQGNIIIS